MNPNRLNPNDLTLYAGVADARLQVDTFHLGHGVALSRLVKRALVRIFDSGYVPTLRELESGRLGPH